MDLRKAALVAGTLSEAEERIVEARKKAYRLLLMELLKKIPPEEREKYLIRKGKSKKAKKRKRR